MPSGHGMCGVSGRSGKRRRGPLSHHLGCAHGTRKSSMSTSCGANCWWRHHQLAVNARASGARVSATLARSTSRQWFAVACGWHSDGRMQQEHLFSAPQAHRSCRRGHRCCGVALAAHRRPQRHWQGCRSEVGVEEQRRSGKQDIALAQAPTAGRRDQCRPSLHRCAHLPRCQAGHRSQVKMSLLAVDLPDHVWQRTAAWQSCEAGAAAGSWLNVCEHYAVRAVGMHSRIMTCALY